MTYLYDNPAHFKDDVLRGFAAAYSRYVMRVPNASGFIRCDKTRDGKAALVVGGGSGHYPSYAGIVGAGFADGCVLGDVFTSPSAEQVYRVAKAAYGGAGVVLAFGNYSGDRLNFGLARERLIADGIDARIVYVTDDIASAPAAGKSKRRGIAGTFTVYKVGGAAAEAGANLDAVERVMKKANSVTFSYGVAFQGCTLPGQSSPIFELPEALMEFGLGIHGEPGIRSASRLPARDIASALVEGILAERPRSAGDRAAVLVNGLGSTKYEELFVLYGHVQQLLAKVGVEPVQPEVGELVTSLNMAGCSLSVTWLDAELEEYWLAPADTVAFRRGATPARSASALPRAEAEPSFVPQVAAQASDASISAAATVRRMIAAVVGVMISNEERLGRLDAVAGDGDHGSGMVRGFLAALDAADAAAGGVGMVLRAAGAAFADKAGGTSGVLWGLLLSAVGSSLGDVEEVTSDRVRIAVRAGAEAIQRAGAARRGDKTMLDALLPFADALDARIQAGDQLGPAWRVAAEQAVEAAAATAEMTPKVGRALPMAARSVGHPDAGATSMGLALASAGGVLADGSCAV